MSSDGLTEEARRRREKFSIFTGIQYATTGGATLLILRSFNRFISHAQRGRAIVGAAGCLYCTVAIEFGLFPFNFFVAERVGTRNLNSSTAGNTNEKNP